MNPLPPYARFLGIRTERSDAGELHFVMPFADVVLGRPGYLHGGAIAGLLEFAAFGALYEALGSSEGVTVKPVNVTVQLYARRRAARHFRRGAPSPGSATGSPMSRPMPGSSTATSRSPRPR